MLTFQDILLVSASQHHSNQSFPSALGRPDLVLVSNNSICLFELTIPTNTQHLLAAEARKEDRNGCLQYDLQLSGLSVHLISIEIGCLGHFMPDTIAQVANVCEVAKKTIRSLFEQAACIAVSCSYRIFNFPGLGSFSLPKLTFSACVNYYYFRVVI